MKGLADGGRFCENGLLGGPEGPLTGILVLVWPNCVWIWKNVFAFESGNICWGTGGTGSRSGGEGLNLGCSGTGVGGGLRDGAAGTGGNVCGGGGGGG